MKITLQQAYPASVSTLWQVFGDPDYPHKKYQALGITRYEVHQFEVSDVLIRLDMTRTLSVPPEKIPAFVRKFVHPEQALRYVSSWRLVSPENADFDLQIIPHGLPVTISAKGTLTQKDARHSVMELSFNITTSVPFIGGKIEALIAQHLEKSYHADHAYTLRYLTENT
jgi:hypothetical protein